MLFPLLITLLVIATLALFGIGAVMVHQQHLDLAQRRAGYNDDSVTVTLGEVIAEITEIDDQALAKLQLELLARQQMADIIG